jgi:hypothetical protein
MNRHGLIIALVACGGCCLGEETELVAVRVPVWHPSSGGTETMEVPQAPPSLDPCDQPAPNIASCSPVAYVRAGAITTQPRCYLDTKIKAGDLGRVMQCPSGTMVVFDGATFVGTSTNGYINACQTTTYDFPQGDSCTWRTEQRIVGTLSGPLTFSYTEGPVAGSECTLSCRAHASLDLVSQ